MTAALPTGASGASPSTPAACCDLRSAWPMVQAYHSSEAMFSIATCRCHRPPADNRPMSSPKVLFGFHAVGVRLKTAPESVIEIYHEATRRDARIRQFLEGARAAGARLIEADGMRIAKLAGSYGHQGVAARVQPVAPISSLDELLEKL